jgi:hypothetical protein
VLSDKNTARSVGSGGDLPELEVAGLPYLSRKAARQTIPHFPLPPLKREDTLGLAKRTLVPGCSGYFPVVYFPSSSCFQGTFSGD